MLLKFPDNFLWGASTSSHQVEGNTHNDWSQWEIKNSKKLADRAKKNWLDWQQKKFPEMFNPENYISGKACNHYNLFEKDFDIAKELCRRLSQDGREVHYGGYSGFARWRMHDKQGTKRASFNLLYHHGFSAGQASGVPPIAKHCVPTFPASSW